MFVLCTSEMCQQDKKKSFSARNLDKSLNFQIKFLLGMKELIKHKSN